MSILIFIGQIPPYSLLVTIIIQNYPLKVLSIFSILTLPYSLYMYAHVQTIGIFGHFSRICVFENNMPWLNRVCHWHVFCTKSKLMTSPNFPPNQHLMSPIKILSNYSWQCCKNLSPAEKLLESRSVFATSLFLRLKACQQTKLYPKITI